MRIGQKDSVVQPADNFLAGVTQRDEVEDVAVFVQFALNRNIQSPVVAMQRFADVSVKRNKVRRAEDQRVFGYASFK